jgi:uncharacterized protein (DUF2384 family)
MASSQPVRAGAAHEAAVATKAVLSAADRLEVSNRALARIIGVSEASVSRMRAGTFTLAPSDKPFELAMVFVRLYRALDAIASGDDATATAWLRSENLALGAAPIELVQTVPGLMHVVDYLDARRALA